MEHLVKIKTQAQDIVPAKRTAFLQTRFNKRKMHCPECQHADTKVVDSRVSNDSVRRRRECLHCGGRFTTYERVHNARLKVEKRSGKLESFSTDKLMRSIEIACAKRMLPVGAIEQIVEEIHERAVNEGREHIESGLIGEMVLNRLKTLDQVAYLRFASVYKDFEDVERFTMEAGILEDADPFESDLQTTFLSGPVSQAPRETARRN